MKTINLRTAFTLLGECLAGVVLLLVFPIFTFKKAKHPAEIMDDACRKKMRNGSGSWFNGVVTIPLFLLMSWKAILTFEVK